MGNESQVEIKHKKISFYSIFSTLSGVITYAIIFLHSLIDLKLVFALILAPIFALVAVITGHKGSRQIRKSDGVYMGKRFARFGLILGYLFLLGCLIVVVLIFTGLISGITSLFGWLGAN